MDISSLKTINATRWAKAKTTRSFGGVALALTVPSAKNRYKSVEQRTGVPWYVIAVIHEREASQNWNTQLAQGDPLHRVSTHIPRGTGPFDTWEDGAYDALVNQRPYAARNKDWSVGGTLTILEEYNGLGYANRGVPSPYIWSGTDQYVSGKYVRDGVYDPNFVDTQLGCAGLLMAMMRIDTSISFGQVIPIVTVTQAPPPPKLQSVPLAVKPTASDNSLISKIIAFFKGK